MAEEIDDLPPPGPFGSGEMVVGVRAHFRPGATRDGLVILASSDFRVLEAPIPAKILPSVEGSRKPHRFGRSIPVGAWIAHPCVLALEFWTSDGRKFLSRLPRGA